MHSLICSLKYYLAIICQILYQWPRMPRQYGPAPVFTQLSLVSKTLQLPSCRLHVRPPRSPNSSPLSTYGVPGIIPLTGATQENKVDKTQALMELK